MYLLTQVLAKAEQVVKTARYKHISSKTGVLIAALASLMFALPIAAQVPANVPADTQTAQIQVENQVNINTADAETLALALDGVGMAKAHDIISYREQNGEFKTVDDLQKVRGIGKATLERNRSRILVVPADE